MKKQLTPFETWMRNQVKKQKQKEDQKIIDEMLHQLKLKNEKESKEKTRNLQQQLEKMRI